MNYTTAMMMIITRSKLIIIIKQETNSMANSYRVFWVHAAKHRESLQCKKFIYKNIHVVRWMRQ